MAGIDERVAIGEDTADSLPKAVMPRGSWWGFVIGHGRGVAKVGNGFDPDAKRGKVLRACKM